VPFTGVPFFWTTQFDATLNYVGHAREWDRIRFDGDPSRHDFLAYYLKGDTVAAVAGMNRDKQLAEFEELMRAGRMPSGEVIEGRPTEAAGEAAR
jgi:3-phenylpropionate/trans-cinnamate dioxygenase ferredoxin reductase subunit